MPNPVTFREDLVEEVRTLTGALWATHNENLRAEARSAIDSRFPAPNFTDPLDRIGQGMPMADILDDLQDFGFVAAAARNKSERVPALVIEEENRVLPVLPP